MIHRFETSVRPEKEPAQQTVVAFQSGFFAVVIFFRLNHTGSEHRNDGYCIEQGNSQREDNDQRQLSEHLARLPANQQQRKENDHDGKGRREYRRHNLLCAVDGSLSGAALIAFDVAEDIFQYHYRIIDDESDRQSQTRK